MRCLIVIFSSLLLATSAFSQNCVAVETILVDACTLGNNGCSSGNSPTCECEGMNEMFRFKVGPNNLNTNNLVINWPNNDFLGLCQNASTAQTVNALNNTIEQCGLLKEPINGVLPAGSRVIVVTSTNVCTASNSFANLADTLYIIFQCPGNYTGHFANFGTGSRTLSMGFGGGCNSTVTYNRSLLVTQTGIAAAEDGASVDFAPNGSITYYNNGCMAPIPPTLVDAGSDVQSCPGDLIQLSAQVEGNYISYNWTGGSGVFSNPNDLQTTYQLGAGDTEDFDLQFSAETCNGWTSSTLTVMVNSGEQVSVSPSGTQTICAGEDLVLTATGNGIITWNDGTIGPEITVNAAGVYTATMQGSCGISSASVTVTEIASPNLSVSPTGDVQICEGEQVTLTAVSNEVVTWSTGVVGNQIVVSSAGTYTAAVNSTCGSVNVATVVTVTAPPQVAIAPNGNQTLCAGATLVLTASGNGTFLWNTGIATPSITISSPGTYSVELTNLCGSDSQEVEILDGGMAPEAEIQIDGPNALCPNVSTQLTGYGDGAFVWSNGSQEESIQVQTGGSYNLSVTNNCGTDVATVFIAPLYLPSVSIVQGSMAAICGDNDLILNAISNTPVTWSTGLQNNSISPQSAGNYYVFTQNQCGVDTAFIEVVEGNVYASFEVSSTGGLPPISIDFENTTIGANFYSWSINGNSASEEFNFTQLFFTPGFFEVSILATDSLGCFDTFSTMVEIEDCPPILFVPNTFTPNGDGINDLFRAEYQCIEEYTMTIVSRWGQEIFSGNQDSAWDGNDGSDHYSSNSVYIYLIQYTDFFGRNGMQTGAVTVIR